MYNKTKKYFSVEIQEQCGGIDFQDTIIVQAKDVYQAEEKAKKIASTWRDSSNPQKPDSNGMYDFREIIVSIGTIRQTNPIEFFESRIF